MYMVPTLPFFMVACWYGGATFTLGALIPFLSWPAIAQYVHPYIHMSTQQVEAEAPRCIRLFSRTPYFRFLAIHHWIHHRYETCNFNLLLGGDLLLSVQRLPSPEDLRKIEALGMWVPASGQPGLVSERVPQHDHENLA